MIIETIVFYLLAVVTVAAGVMVIASRNPVQSVLFLILAFFNSAGLFVLLGAEFLAMILIIVYVGAVAVLFLFVVMMLDIRFTELRQGFLKQPVGLRAVEGDGEGVFEFFRPRPFGIAKRLPDVAPVAPRPAQNGNMSVPAGEKTHWENITYIFLTIKENILD